MEKIRYYNNNTGPIKEAEVLAFKKAIQLCDELENINEVVLLIHTKNNTGYLERIFETRNLNPYFKGIKLNPNYPIFKIETVKTFSDQWQKSIILISFGLRSEEISKYEEFESVKAIIAHQWIEPDVQNWAKTWGAINIETNSPSEKMPFPDKVVQEALNDLSDSINMVTGITHPSDNEQCKTYLRALHKYGYELNATKIFSYLTAARGWESDNANDVIKLINKLNSGGYFMGGEKTGLQNYIKDWKSRK
ncbi:hypothetical protein [Flavobacterium pallidum]|uniref:Uncharacterized protein n=1 Tax=Flavobacterium pallidum TaxID=2172098 RepID=A0A2S1SKH7_9FLAO|nr:hypothetical protein [Flavobacterium pallidum]AWI26872.1 hypothetical protein HYN49_13705 [Flavobacterium pallidum]